MSATLTFNTRENAQLFCQQWTRYSLRGHTMGAGTKNVEVKLYDVTEDNKQWIDSWVAANQ